MTIISIDPGVRTGWATWSRKGRLLAHGTVGSPQDLPAEGVQLCIVEVPRVYSDRRKWKGDPQHIVSVAFVAGMCAGRYPEHIGVEPVVWRSGNAPKDAVWRRVEKELGGVDGRTSQHSRDAIGIGLWYLRSEGVR